MTNCPPGIIDADLHIADLREDLVPYTDLPWRRAIAEPAPNPPWSLHGTLYPSLRAPERDLPLPARTPGDLIAQMDRDGIAAGVALPTHILKIGGLPIAAYAGALARAYNRWLDAVWLGEQGRIHGALVAAPQEPEDAAREIARYAGHCGVAAVLLPMGGTDPLWGDRRYDPIYAAAVDAGLPVILHGGGDLVLPGTPSVTPVFVSRFEQHAMSQPLVAMANLVSMVGTGVFARFPDLRVLFLEAGISWFAHIMLRMDKEYNENRRDIPHYTDRISAYLKRQVWLGTHPCESVGRPEDLGDIVRISVGVEHLVYGSHWPFADRDLPERIAAAFPDAAVRSRVMGGNAAALFGIAADGSERRAAPQAREA